MRRRDALPGLALLGLANLAVAGVHGLYASAKLDDLSADEVEARLGQTLAEEVGRWEEARRSVASSSEGRVQLIAQWPRVPLEADLQRLEWLVRRLAREQKLRLSELVVRPATPGELRWWQT